MDPSDLFDLYRQLQQYVGWTEADPDCLGALKPILEPHFPAIVDDFYAEIARHPDAKQVLTGGNAQIALLKLTLTDWLRDLFTGPYDEVFVAKRFSVGLKHVEVRLEAHFPLAALARIRTHLNSILVAELEDQSEELDKALGSLNRILDLELTIIEIAYQNEAQRRNSEQVRLAMLGKVSAGIAHELRNPLNAIKTSTYYLLNAESPPPEKVEEHLNRIDRQVTISDEVITALSRFAKLPTPRMLPFDLWNFVDATIADSPTPANISIEIERKSSDDSPTLVGDQEQLKIVLSNILRNGFEAMPLGGTIKIRGRRMIEVGDHGQGHGSDRVSQSEFYVLSVIDSGHGIKPEDLAWITEPLYSTKTKGLGLGLALSSEIMQRHGGSLQVESQPGQGSTISLLFNLANP